MPRFRQHSEALSVASYVQHEAPSPQVAAVSQLWLSRVPSIHATLIFAPMSDRSANCQNIAYRQNA